MVILSLLLVTLKFAKMFRIEIWFSVKAKKYKKTLRANKFYENEFYAQRFVSNLIFVNRAGLVCFANFFSAKYSDR